MLTGLLIFVLVVIALLAIPLVLEFTFEWPADENNEIVLVWALGLVRLKIQTKGSEPTPSVKAASTDAGKSGQSRSPNVLAAVRLRPFRQRVLRFVGDLWRSINKDNVSVRARIGLGDPADTGELWAILGPISGMVAGMNRVSIALQPDFADLVFEVDGRGRLRFVPLRIIGIFIGLLFSPAIWRGLRTMRAS